MYLAGEQAGVIMPLAVQIDRKHTELSESNNNAATTLTVNADIRPNLAVSYEEHRPSLLIREMKEGPSPYPPW